MHYRKIFQRTAGWSALILILVSGSPGQAVGDAAPVSQTDPALDTSGPFTTVRPCTLLDTRRRKQGPALRSDVRKLVRAHVRKCGIPESSTSVSLKATVFQPTGQGNLRFYRGDITPPSPHSAILRFQRGRVVSRRVVVPVSEDCDIAVLPFVAGGGETHVLLEVTGFYE